MMIEEWSVHTKLIGDFYIIDEELSSEMPMVEGLRKMTISPEFKDSKWTGLHELEAVLFFHNKEGTQLKSHLVFERAISLVENITSLATLGIGRPVRISGGVSVKRRPTKDLPTYRFITQAAETGSFAPPASIPSELLTISIDSRIKRIIKWWARGVAASDAVDRLVSLNNALDLLSGMADGVPGRVRKCKKCGVKEKIGPGLRERVVYFLTDSLGYNLTVATDIYESRLDLVHARSNLVQNDLQRYRKNASLVAIAVRTGIARALGVTLPPIPESLPFDFPSALLDIVYTEGETPENHQIQERSIPMNPSDELKNLTLRYYDGMAAGDIKVVEQLFSRKDGVLAIGTDPSEWWAGYNTIVRLQKEQFQEIGGIKIKAGELNAFVEGTVGWGADQPTFKLPNGQEMTFRATFVFHREDGEWKIVQFHLSIGVPNEEAVGKELTTK